MRSPQHHALPEIIGSVLKDAREQKNIARAELANLCCLSSKMILELEEGGMSSFYTFELKVATAKRVGRYLGLDESSYLSHPSAIEAVEDASIPPSEVQEVSASKKHGAAMADSNPKNPPLRNEATSSTEQASPQLPNLGELLDDATTKHGLELSAGRTSLISMRLIAIPFGVLVLSGALYGLNDRFNLVNSVIGLVNPPPVIVVNNTQDLKADTDLAPKSDSSDTAVKASETPPAQAPLSTTSEQCPYKQEAPLASYQSPNPSKRGDIVNIKSLIKQVICVVDNSGKQTVVNLEPNASYAFRGSSPFVVITQDLDSVEMYFQGWRVRSPSSGAKQIKLIEVAL